MLCGECERTDIKCCVTCARDSANCEVWHNCGEDCPSYELDEIVDKETKQTYNDRLNAMSPEEKAKFFAEQFCHGYGEAQILEWLKSEVKE